MNKRRYQWRREGISYCMNERTNELMSGRTNERTKNQRMNEERKGLIYECRTKGAIERTSEWMNEWTDKGENELC